jgi:hypothetical protein
MRADLTAECVFPSSHVIPQLCPQNPREVSQLGERLHLVVMRVMSGLCGQLCLAVSTAEPLAMGLGVYPPLLAL